jgi:hypothetical protein
MLNKAELTARIRLDTGPAVIDAAGEIYGDVANIAAWVQAWAEPGAVVVTARVQRYIAGLFVAESRGTHTLKGVCERTAVSPLAHTPRAWRCAASQQCLEHPACRSLAGALRRRSSRHLRQFADDLGLEPAFGVPLRDEIARDAGPAMVRAARGGALEPTAGAGVVAKTWP